MIKKSRYRFALGILVMAAPILTFPLSSQALPVDDQYVEVVPSPGKERPTKEVIGSETEERPVSTGTASMSAPITAIETDRSADRRDAIERQKKRSDTPRPGALERLEESSLSPTSASGVNPILASVLALILLIGLGGAFARRHFGGLS